MSVGVHIGIASLGPNAVGDIQKCLAKSGLGPYDEPEGIDDSDFYPVFCGCVSLGRSGLDHGSAKLFYDLALVARSNLGDTAVVFEPLISQRHACVYLPCEVPNPVELTHAWICGALRLRDALVELAPHIGVGMEGRDLSDAEAEAINDESGEDGKHALRTVWLMLFEAARVCSPKGMAFYVA